MLNVRDIHKGYSGVLEFQILIWKRPPTPPSRLKLASRILSRLVLNSAGLLTASKSISTKMFIILDTHYLNAAFEQFQDNKKRLHGEKINSVNY